MNNVNAMGKSWPPVTMSTCILRNIDVECKLTNVVKVVHKQNDHLMLYVVASQQRDKQADMCISNVYIIAHYFRDNKEPILNAALFDKDITWINIERNVKIASYVFKKKLTKQNFSVGVLHTQW